MPAEQNWHANSALKDDHSRLFESLGTKGLFPPWPAADGPFAAAAVLFRLAVNVDVTAGLVPVVGFRAPARLDCRLLRVAPYKLPAAGLVPTFERSGTLTDRRVTERYNHC